MAGLTKDQAVQALSLGWSRSELTAYNSVFVSYGLTGNLITRGYITLHGSGRYIAHKGADPLNIVRSIHAWPGGYVCYTDGSGTTKDRVAGIGVVVYEEKAEPRYIAECIGNGTNNKAELSAIYRALREIPDLKRKVTIYSDSEYSIGAITNESWVLNKNQELILTIREDVKLRDSVTLLHCDGHSKIEGNEVADRLANIGRKLVTKVTCYVED